MIFQSLVRKNLLILVLITAIYFSYASFFLKPWELANFSLVDDGQVLIQSSSYLEDCVLKLKCSKFIDQTFEFGTSRFRPTYWLINNLVYEVFRNNADLHHAFRVYVVGYVSVILLSLALLDLRVSSLFVFVGALVFATNYSFSENVIRLGTNEPLQVVFLSAFSLLYLNFLNERKRMSSVPWTLVALLSITILIKENSIAILPVIFLTEILAFGKGEIRTDVFWVGIPLLIFVTGSLITKILPSTISTEIPVYTSNYVTSLPLIFRNSVDNVRLLLNSLSPFLKISLLLFPSLILIKKTRKELKNRAFFFWIIFGLFFMMILFPWRYVLERYQLVAVFAIIIISMFLLDRATEFFWTNFLPANKERIRTFFQAITTVLVLALFLRGFPLNLAKTINYRNWFFRVSQIGTEQVALLAKYSREAVFINAKNNLDNWEWLYEVPIHLKYLYGIESDLELLKKPLPDKGHIFSQSLLEPQIPLEELARMGYEVVEQKSYTIAQLDPLEFRNKFFSNLISTIISPSAGDYYEYYWEIRRID